MEDPPVPELTDCPVPRRRPATTENMESAVCSCRVPQRGGRPEKYDFVRYTQLQISPDHIIMTDENRPAHLASPHSAGPHLASHHRQDFENARKRFVPVPVIR